MKKLKIILLVLVIGFVGIQFIPANLNQSNETPQEDIIDFYKAPNEVATLLRTSCYDCHSNNTNYQWFNKIKPAFWLMQMHIKDAKKDLNFNEFGSYSKRKQKSKFKSLVSQIEDNEMPLKSYLLMHSKAKLSKQDKDVLIKWFEKVKDSL